MKVVVAGAALTTHVFDHLLVVVEKDLYLLRLVARLPVKFIVSGTLAHLVHSVNINVHILAILFPYLDHTIKQVSLQFNGLCDVKIIRNRHAFAKTNALVLIGVNF